MSRFDHYNLSGQVYRGTVTVGGMGDASRTMAVSGAAFACRIRQASATERSMSGSRGVDISHRMYCAATVDVLPADEVHIGTIIYRIENVNDVDQMGHHLEVDMRERIPERNER